jgi:hypothetical protein
VAEQIEQSIAEAVHGPPLSNFVCYFAVEALHSGRTTAETIISSPGQNLSLVASVVRDGGARQREPGRPEFLASESVIIENGSDDPTASFDVVADSPALRVSPSRAGLVVTDSDQADFQLQMPESPGTHEIWFQLFQGGRVVQVLTVAIEVIE